MKRKCEKCGSEFETNNENKRFCTERCRKKEEKKRYNKKFRKPIQLKNCMVCSKEFISSLFKKLYCSRLCYWNARNKRRNQHQHNRLIKSYYASIGRACKIGFVKDERWLKRFGYSPKQLCRHIESKMLLGMTWANYGTVWHIDHIVPIAEVIGGVKSIDDVFSLSNLMPRFSTTKMANTFGWNQVGNLNKGAGKVNVYQI